MTTWEVRPVRASIALALALTLTACPRRDETNRAGAADAAPALASVASVAASPATGDAGRGKELVLRYECNRCHEGTGHASAARGKHCVQCHTDITEGRFEAPPATLAKWKPRVKDLGDAPSLEAAGKRFSRAWIEQYLIEPADLRPHLAPSMPRLAMTRQDARDIAAYLAPDEPAGGKPGAPPAEIAGADLGAGRKVLDTKGCGSCHAFTGVANLDASPPPPMDGAAFARGHVLAPDLRVTRDRMSAARLVAWLADPKAVKPDSAMPKIALTATEIRDVAGYLLGAELAAPPTPAKGARLPVLTRKVTYDEVDAKVFHRTCWHCHSEPDYAIGDGGPGNSGGFGFKPRGLNLVNYAGIAAGYVDDKGERASVFAKDDEGVPQLVRALLARHDEQAGAPTGAVRGMPLGYPALSPEDIQLVESWIAQGRPR